MIMKKVIFFLLPIFLFACNKNKDGYFIKAGSKPVLAYYGKFNAEDKVQSLDVNKDGVIDFVLGGSTINGSNAFYSNDNILAKNDFMIANETCENNIMARKILNGEIINSDLLWSSGYVNFIYKYDYSNVVPFNDIDCTEWLATTAYIGIRMEKGKEYKYGWIKVRVNDYFNKSFFLEYCLLK